MRAEDIEWEPVPTESLERSAQRRVDIISQVGVSMLRTDAVDSRWLSGIKFAFASFRVVDVRVDGVNIIGIVGDELLGKYSFGPELSICRWIMTDKQHGQLTSLLSGQLEDFRAAQVAVVEKYVRRTQW